MAQYAMPLHRPIYQDRGSCSLEQWACRKIGACQKVSHWSNEFYSVGQSAVNIHVLISFRQEKVAAIRHGVIIHHMFIAALYTTNMYIKIACYNTIIIFPLRYILQL